MRELYKKHKEKINYLLVGGWNTVFGYCAFILLYSLLSSQIHYLIIFVISNIIGITNAYINYKLFVFQTRGNYLREYFRFYLVYGASIVLNLILLPLCVEFLNLTPVVASGGLSVFSAIISYLGHKNFSFSRDN